MKKSVQNKKKNNSERIYAGFWIRLVAFIVDLVIAIIIGVISSIVLEVLLEIAGLAEAMPIVDRYIGTIVIWTYFIYLTYNFDATFGKRLVGIEVVSAKKEKLRFLQVVYRETIGKIISFIVFGIGFIMVIFDKKKQSFHDKLGGTEVVKKDKDFSKKQKIIYFATVGFTALIFAVVVLGGLTWLLKINEAKNQARNGAAQVVVFQTAVVGSECQMQGGEVLQPSNRIGGGNICSIDLGVTWPEVSNGFSYGEIKNEKSVLISEDGEMFECKFENLSCNFE